MADLLPQPPFHLIPGLPNFRDLGSYPIEGRPGKTVRRGVVFRSSEPSQLTDEGADQLRALGITHVYDLRSVKEIERAITAPGGAGQVKEWPGSKRLFVPVFLDRDYSPEAIALRFQNYCSPSVDGFVQAYKAILDAGSEPSHPWAPFKTILTHLASPEPPEPLLIHCTAGKDRTGIICAVILGICGVADDVIADEYSLTDLGLQHRRQEFVDSLLKSPALKGDPDAVERMISSRTENMLATLELIRNEHGSIDDFVLNRCGLAPEELERIRENLIVDDR